MKRRKNSPHPWKYDPTRKGIYHVTLCTKYRLHHFGKIRDGEMMLNNIGSILAEHISEIPAHFCFIKVLESCVMPDHCHLLLEHTGEKRERGTHLGVVIGALKASVTQRVNRTQSPMPWPIWQRAYNVQIVNGPIDGVATYIRNNPRQSNGKTRRDA
jgi:REP element-mobilizing transposase RayT